MTQKQQMYKVKSFPLLESLGARLHKSYLYILLTSVLRVSGQRVNLQSGALSLNKHLVELCDLIHSLCMQHTDNTYVHIVGVKPTFYIGRVHLLHTHELL